MRFTIVVVVTLALVCGLSSSYNRAAPAPEAKWTKWEYKVVTDKELAEMAWKDDKVSKQAQALWAVHPNNRGGRDTLVRSATGRWLGDHSSQHPWRRWVGVVAPPARDGLHLQATR
jgi:hypothetical protein